MRRSNLRCGPRRAAGGRGDYSDCVAAGEPADAEPSPGDARRNRAAAAQCPGRRGGIAVRAPCRLRVRSLDHHSLAIPTSSADPLIARFCATRRLWCTPPTRSPSAMRGCISRRRLHVSEFLHLCVTGPLGPGEIPGRTHGRDARDTTSRPPILIFEFCSTLHFALCILHLLPRLP